MPRKSQAFKGPGRKLGTGEKVVPQKKSKDSDYEDSGDEENASDEEELAAADKIDEELAEEERLKGASPSTMVNSDTLVRDGEELTDGDSDGGLSHKDAADEGDDYIEVNDLNNRCIRMLKGDDDADESIEENIKNDERFESQNKRRMYRMATVIKRTAENNKVQGKIMDFSDEAPEKSRETKVKMERCTQGNFITTRNENGKLQYKQLTQDQIKEMDLGSSKMECSCSVCRRRRAYAGDKRTDYGRTESRSGKKRGFYKYGEGQVLGEDEDKKAKRKK